MTYEPSVLVIDDDPKICRLLQLNLQAEGYQVFTASSGRQGLDMLFTRQPDALILDLILLDIDGLALCERVREISDIPIIILTSRKNDDTLAESLLIGADDYIVKPFSQKVLTARLNALLRRTKSSQSGNDLQNIVYGDIALHCREQKISFGSHAISLSKTEFRLLYVLMKNANRLVTTDELIAHVWGFDAMDTQGLRTYIRYLRQKVEDDPQEPKRILTERGLGYIFVREN